MIDGYSSAGNILSGKLLGAKDYQTLLKLSRKLTKYGFVIGGCLTIFGGLFYESIGTVFTKDPVVLEKFYASFWIILAMQPLCMYLIHI